MRKQTAIVTSAPEIPAPVQRCPRCDSQLIYRETIIGGVQPRERWDYYECRRCGPFQFRHRTRLLRSIMM